MSNLNSKLIKYKNLNLVAHLNETFPTYEKAVIEMEKDKTNSTKSYIETEIFKVFLQNSDSLLDILNTYESVYNKLTELRDIYYRTNFQSEDVVPVDKKKLRDFRGILKKFITDISSFDTGQRVLEFYEFVGQYIFLMTNDILFIGKKSDVNYTLVNTFNYSIIDLETTDKLTVKMGDMKLVYEGEQENINKIGRKFQQLSYTYEDSVSTETEKTSYDADLKDYFIQTEKYDQLIKNDMIFIGDKTLRFYDFSTLQRCTKKNDLLLVSFLKDRFNELLLMINKIDTLENIITRVFDYFYKFYFEEKDIFKEKNIKFLLLLEDHILECFKFFEKRLLSRKFYSKTLDEILNLISTKLIFDNNDYSYMVEYFTDKLNQQKEKFLDKGRDEIKQAIMEYLR